MYCVVRTLYHCKGSNKDGGEDGHGRADGAGAAHGLLTRECRVGPVAEFPAAKACLGGQDAQDTCVRAIAGGVTSAPAIVCWDLREQCVWK